MFGEWAKLIRPFEEKVGKVYRKKFRGTNDDLSKEFNLVSNFCPGEGNRREIEYSFFESIEVVEETKDEMDEIDYKVMVFKGKVTWTKKRLIIELSTN